MDRMHQLHLLNTLVCLLLYYIQQTQGACPDDRCVTCTKKIKPNHGSTEGGVLITITGENFLLASGQSNDPDEGSQPYLVCSEHTYPCIVEQTTTKKDSLVCLTPKIPQADADCKVFIKNNGEMISEHCITGGTYWARNDRTPEVFNFLHSPFVPKTSGEVLVTIKARTFTARTDSTQPDSSGRIVKRTFTDTVIADMVGISNFNENVGDLTFRDKTSYGCHSVTFFVEGDEYGGSSKTTPALLKWSPEGQIYSYQTYPVIENISPNVSSIAGGTHITLTGIGNVNPSDVVVKVGGAVCEVVAIKETYLVCRTPPKPDFGNHTFHPGNRGIRCKFLDGEDETPRNGTGWCDYFGFVDQENGEDYSSQFSGCFKPSTDWPMLLKLTSDDDGKAYFNHIPGNDTENLIMETRWNNKRDYYPGPLSKDECYYVRGWHRQGNGASNFHLGVHLPHTENKYTKKDKPYPFVSEEIQIVHSCSKTNYEWIWNFTLPRSKVKISYDTEETDGEKVESSDALKKIFYNLLSCHCPRLSSGIVYNASYEDPEADGNYDQRHLSWHAITKCDAYCGHVSMKNPGYIYRHKHDYLKRRIILGKGKGEAQHLCLAGKGSFSKIRLKVVDPNSEWDITKALGLKFTPEWEFYCLNLYDAIPGAKGKYKLEYIIIDKTRDARFNYFVDYVHIGKYAQEEYENVKDKRNRKCINPGEEMVQSVSVKQPDENNLQTFEVAVYVCNCAINLEPPNITSSSGKISIGDRQKTRRGATGWFKLGLHDKVTEAIPIDSTARTVQELINAALPVKVEVYDWSNHCFRPHFNIYYKTMSEDQPQLLVNSSDVSCDKDDKDPVNIYTYQDGGIFLEDIPEDMFRTIHTDPQVTFEYQERNKCRVPAKCDMNEERNCGISWDESITPNVTRVQPEEGQDGTTITIDGQNLEQLTGGEEDLTTVTIGGTLCTLVDITGSTQLTCTIGKCGQGNHKVNVHIRGKGDARHPADNTVTFQCLAGITDFNSTAFGSQGGYNAVITGFGFHVGHHVTIGGNPGTNLVVSYNQIQFEVPAGTVGDQPLVVFHGDVSTPTVVGSLNFTYQEAINLTIQSVDPTEVLVSGDDLVTITGTNFPPMATIPQSDINVIVDGKKTLVVSYDSEQQKLVFKPPRGAPGDYQLKVKFGHLGFSTSVVTLRYKLHVTSVCPERGSYAGGTSITITGSGFTNTSVVTIGGVPCTLIDNTDTEIVCITGPIHKTWTVTNEGYHPVYGQFFAWEPKDINIKQGDTVLWDWDMHRPTNEYVLHVEETDSAISKAYYGSGFQSGAATSRGTFKWTFPDTGIRHYWSGYIDVGVNDRYTHGSIDVSNRTSESFPVVVTVDGHTAPYKTQGAASCVTADMASCTDDPPVGDGGPVGFCYCKCSTPVITEMQPSEDVHPDSNITFTVSRGIAQDSEVTVKVCDKECQVTTLTTNSLSCTIQPDSNMTVNQQCYVIVAVAHFGHAYLKIADTKDKSLDVRAAIRSVTPNKGSEYGGTLLNITGIGLVNVSRQISFVIDNNTFVQCEVLGEPSYTDLQCKMNQPNDPQNGTGPVTSIQGFFYAPSGTVECTSPACRYLYKPENTPAIDEGFVDQIPASIYTWVLTGTNLDGAKIHIWQEKTPDTPFVISCVTVTNSRITCPIVNLPRREDGYFFRIITVDGFSSTHRVNAHANITSYMPSRSNRCGGLTLTIIGHGFPADDVNDVTVKMGHKICPITSLATTKIECVLPPASNTKELRVLFPGNVVKADNDFQYTSELDFTTTLLSIDNGTAPNPLTITGTLFGTNATKVSLLLGEVLHMADTVNETSIAVSLLDNAAGVYKVIVLIEDKGCSDSLTFTYNLEVQGFSPSEGGFGGNQELTILGTGFNLTNTKVTICGQPTGLIVNNYTTLTVTTPAISNRTDSTNGALSCIVSVSVGGDFSQNASDVFTYRESLTPTITSVTPARGGTGGNTRITISGSNFGDSGFVTIKDVGLCNGTISWSPTTILCNVPRPSYSHVAMVVVTTDQGDSYNEKGEVADFWYIDRWSSIYTWGGNPPPLDGEFVHIYAEQCILIDADTAVLKMLLIDGGCIIFDKTVLHITLAAEYIMIVNNGTLQIGTEDEPHCPNKVTIKMFGSLQSLELPIYGAKALAIRNGSLLIYGCPIETTWTRLSQTAEVGDTTIHLNPPALDWKVGDTIVIASTAGPEGWDQSEECTITAISSDKTTLTIDPPLKAEHLGHTYTIAGYRLPMHAEIGLLTRNIMFRGDGTNAALESLPPCRDDLVTGAFASQTCMTGPFQLGGHIIGHNPNEDSMAVTIRISFLELYFVGQAFRLGRYPIHFHLNGDMTGSFVRGCSIHETFNRGINIHGSHNLLIEHNVVHKSMGGTFFLEDGVETGNRFLYNLVMNVRSSSSLLNDDLTPAAFWITNPDNTYSNNAAAGGHSFGFWLRTHSKPDGASADKEVNPQEPIMREFKNNTAHSFGQFGLWIFETYKPLQPSVFEDFTVYNCEKGAEWVDVSKVHFKGFISFNNTLAQYEAKLQSSPVNSEMFTLQGSVVQDAFLCNYIGPDAPTNLRFPRAGAILPQLSGVLYDNITFACCSGDTVAITFAHISGTCSDGCRGYIHKMTNIHWENCEHRAHFEWDDQATLIVDESFTGSKGYILPTKDILPPGHCANYSDNYKNEGVDLQFCDNDVHPIRFAFNKIGPFSYEHKDVCYLVYGKTSCSPYRAKRKTHGNGWASLILAEGTPPKDTYMVLAVGMSFLGGTSTVYIKYTGKFYRIPKGICLDITFQLDDVPDRVQILSKEGYVNESTELAKTGDWNYKPKALTYRVCGPPPDGSVAVADVEVAVDAHKCQYKGCGGPPEVVFNVFSGCSNTSKTWDESKVAGDGVVIAADTCVNITESGTYRVTSLVVLGTLEVENREDITVTIQVKYMLVLGGYFVVGRDGQPFQGKFTLVLTADEDVDDQYFTYGDVKAEYNIIHIYGGIELHGQEKYPWTKLTETVKDDKTIKLNDRVDATWEEGDEIILTATGFAAGEAEKAILHRVEQGGKTLILKNNVEYEHLGSSHETHRELSGNPFETVKTQGEVCSLNRNIKISGVGNGVGFSVIVSRGVNVIGYARIRYVEFIEGGKEGKTLHIPGQPEHWSECALMFLSLGDTNTETTLPNWVKYSVFYDNHGVGICIIDSDKVEAKYVVLHKSNPNGFYVSATSVVIDDSVVIDTIAAGNTGGSQKNLNYHSAFHIQRVEEPTLRNNIGAGFQRSCIKLPHIEYRPFDPETLLNNECHSGLIGIERYIKDGPEGADKYMVVRNFFSWHCWDFGVFIEVKTNIIIKNYTGVSNGNSLFLMVLQPEATSHKQNICAWNTKKIRILDSLLSGRAPDSTCLTTDVDKGKSYFDWTRKLGEGARRGPERGFIGIVTQFSSRHNDAGGEHPFAGIMAYNTVCGLVEIKGTVFSHFNDRCGHLDAFIGINENNEDLTHPIHLSDSTRGSNVDDKSLVYMPVPDAGKVDKDDCGDMICDGKKKAIIKDLDKTFFKSQRAWCTAISDSAYEWGGDIRFMVNNNRLHKKFRFTDENTPVLTNIQYPIKGIYRKLDCAYNENWRAYLCCELEYFQLVIESLDEDTEERRLAPVTVHSYEKSDRNDFFGALDLVNGPQDHGWCAGYGCNKRVSNFHIVVVAGKYFDVYFASTSPQNIRLQMLNSASHHCVRLSLYNSKPFKIDVYSINADTKNEEIVAPAQEVPDLSGNPSSGTNYQDTASHLLNIVICGPQAVIVKQRPKAVMIAEIPNMTPEELYDKQVAENLAAFLETPKENIKAVQIISEPNARRRKRQTDTMELAITIESPPTTLLADADAAAQQTQDSGSALVGAFQLGILDDVLDIPVSGAKLRQPPPPPGSDAWADYAADENADQPVTIQVPHSAISLQAPKPSHEGAYFSIHPSFHLLDAQNSPIELLGTLAVPWRMKAELVLGEGSDPQAVLWDNEVSFYKGWANFTKLSISHSGSGYGLRFYVSYPAEASSRTALQVSVSDLTVAKAAFKAQVKELPTEILPTTSFTVSVDVLDSVTNMLPRNISWKGHTFTATLSIDGRTGYPGTLSPSSELQMGLSTGGSAMTGNLRLDSVGRAILSISVVSTPEGFSLSASSSPIDVNQVLLSSRSAKGKSQVMMRVPGLSELRAGLLPFFLAAVQNRFSPVYKDVTFNNFTRSENEMHFTVLGRPLDIEKATDAIWDTILEGFKISSGGKSYAADAYMLVDGEERVGEKKTESGNLIAIIAGSIVGVILIIIVVAVLAWFFLKEKPKSAVEPTDATEANVENAEKGTVSDNGKQDQDSGKSKEADAGKAEKVERVEVEDIVEEL